MSLLSNLQTLITAVGADIKALYTAVNAISFPSQAGNAGKVLKTDAANKSWDYADARSSTASAVPATTDLGLGQKLINTNDGVIYFKKNVGGTETVLCLRGQNPLGTSTLMWTQSTNLMWTQ